MAAYEARMTHSEAEVAALKAKLNKDETAIAFHAWSTSDITATPRGTVIVPHVATNIGNAYDHQTGFFTAPVSGLYMFHATFMDHDHTDYSEAGIFVDGSSVATSVSDSRHGFWDNPAIAAVVHVTAGQRVQLRNVDNSVRYFYRGQYTTFSGFLIRAD
nr:hypothetical protein BaRGS_018708 [Batillaria attramentaria]